jgi:transposase
MPPVEEILQENAQLKAELSGKDSVIAGKSERIAELEAQIAWFRRQMFAGGKSEKIDPAQLELLLKGLDEAKAEQAQSKQISYERKPSKPRRSREELYGNLPILEESVIEPEEVKSDPQSYERFGEEETFEIKVDPPRFYRKRIVRPKYRKIGDKTLPPIVAPAPVRVVEGLASADLLAYIVVAKFLDHLPLYRQCAIYKRYGFTISRQNLVRWVEKAAQWIKPIYIHMQMELLGGDYLQVDETPIQYCDPDYGERKSRKGWLCAYSRPKDNVCFKWSVSRAHEPVTSHLKGFEGVVQSDGYQPYITFAAGSETVELAACWAHARRKFFDCKDLHPRECGVYLKLVARLYAVEQEIRERRSAEKGFDDEAALKLRAEKSANTHVRIHRVLIILRRNCLPKSGLGKACDYSLRLWEHLSTYLSHGRVEIDNNLMENAIRPTAIGKKNWLFVGHPEAGERPAILYSILISCQRLEVDPATYLRDVLSMDLPNMSEEQLAELTPKNWKKSTSV